MAPKRISMSLFDDELKSLINASAKIFPITQLMVDTNSNPDNYEYGRIERSIYRWSGTAWEYIVADDVDIKWSDVLEKPTVFPPDVHLHAELHEHTNKSLLDTVTQLLVDGWNNAVSHISDAIKHITSEERTLWNTIVTHTHSDLHSHTNKTTIDKLIDTGVETTYDIKYLKDVENIINGYTEGHSHGNLTVLDNIAVEDVALWDTVGTHLHDDRYYTESEINTQMASKADATTLSGHTSNTTVHVTQTDKDAWNAGRNFATIGTVKPTDGSMWYQEIV
jgi:hypothetical protein